MTRASKNVTHAPDNAADSRSDAPDTQRDAADTRRDVPLASDSAWSPSGIVTLTTDFGSSDPYVGMMHGEILCGARDARIVDVTHGVPPQDVRAAGFFLAHARRSFPAGTVHVAVVDPGVGSARRLLVVLDRGHAFLAPDNGLLERVVSADADVRELDFDRFARANASRTFHGRDVLAPAAAALVSGTSPSDAARGLRLPWKAPAPRAFAHEVLATEVLCVDHYGNAILDVAVTDLAGKPHEWCVDVAGNTLRVRGTYADAHSGELLALVDSYAHIEIAVRDGDAAARLTLQPGSPVTLRRQR